MSVFCHLPDALQVVDERMMRRQIKATMTTRQIGQNEFGLRLP